MLQKTAMGIEMTNKTIPEFFPNRFIFSVFLIVNERQFATLAYQIFMGTTPPPTSPQTSLLGGDKKETTQTEKAGLPF